VKIATWEELFRLITGMYSTRLQAFSWGIIGLWLGDAYHIFHGVSEPTEMVRNVFNRLRNHMHDNALALDVASDPKQAPVHDSGAKLLIDLLPNHYI
tara:strand:- start:135 stop:425 length:291 start_codon:yes stop_codon:yes gene_type:complete